MDSLEAQNAECKQEMEATKAASEAKIKLLMKEIVNLKKITKEIPADLLKLPAPQLTVDDVEFLSQSGNAFQNIHSFIKKTIIDACA